MSDLKEVRVRIAPSPTGDPHVGLAYMTLFNYVFAKKHGGKLVLRVEDTDQTRAKASSQQLIMDSLKWLGLSWDEGPDVGGEFGPYMQSQRKTIHAEHAQILLERGKAYRCFCTSERLDKLRGEQRKAGLRTGYDGHCRSLSDAEVSEKLAQNQANVIRMKVPVEGSTTIVDELRGAIAFENTQLDDQVLIKSDGFPTYHLANVVDDHLMKISHVIRAEEWVSSTPKHVLLYEAFGWECPKFVHLPILRNPDKSKISKRKNPVSLEYYRRKGILPVAMQNFLALMGWSYSDDQEFFSLQQMIEKFELKQIHLGGPIFDVVKLARINQHYIQQMSASDFVNHVRDDMFSTEYLERLFPLVKERIDSFEQLVDKANFFFNGALSYEDLPIVPKKKEVADLRAMLKDLLLELDELYVWKAEKIQELLDSERQRLNWKPKDYYMPVRLIATGRKDSPPLAESLELIGREMLRFRIRNYLQFLQKQN